MTEQEKSHESNEARGKAISVDAGPIHFTFDMSEAEVTVIKADNIRVEQSPQPKYLSMRAGDIQVFSTVEIQISGKWYELTKDSSQEFEG